ncbi:uncharacterized protein LOC105702709 isoform X2 [Orussus abietinus]|uniref:uncharacterized protein LOC105702709 isoform X2 n=1 Tax=Orussus abietinus TaxID=222816 RepID=UPI000626A35B|nr:uncharacterized protein LOC105702709 isoform X2 [Orussus abietinus]
MEKRYRVEAFLVPHLCVKKNSEVNEIDDVKVANRFILDKILEHSWEESEDVFGKIEGSRSTEDFKSFEEPIYDTPYEVKSNSKLQKTLTEVKPPTGESRMHRFRSQSPGLDAPRPPPRTVSLKPIYEREELSNEDSDRFCYHGFENGCTASVQKPEEVSQEIFKTIWLQKLETLRKKETTLKDKEIALEDFERLLRKRERELLILERLAKEKMRKAELYLKRCKSSQSAENIYAEREIAFDVRSSASSKDSNEHCDKDSKNDFTHHLPVVNNAQTENIGVVSEVNVEDRILRNPPNSRSSLAPASLHGSSNSHLGSNRGRISVYGSFRSKPRPKITYDDLNSTLSADIGDSSFVVTSRKFDPEKFKKPHAFTRPVDERHVIQENVQDRSTKYQNYGPVDEKVSRISNGKSTGFENKHSMDDKRFSYLNLESGKVDIRSKHKESSKDRPISWNEEANEWLQKKREAYNLATQRMPMEDYENKENFGAKSRMSFKEKKGRGMKFTIFR